jgi:hypothetical protein
MEPTTKSVDTDPPTTPDSTTTEDSAVVTTQDPAVEQLILQSEADALMKVSKMRVCATIHNFSRLLAWPAH